MLDRRRGQDAMTEVENMSGPTTGSTQDILHPTLDFMEWLGIHVPDNVKQELTESANPAGRSIEIATEIARDLIRYCQARSIPFGFNIESVAVRKEEVDASLRLLETVNQLLKTNGLRKAATVHVDAVKG